MGIDKEVKINLMANEHQARKKRLKSWAMLLAALLSILAAMIYVHIIMSSVCKCWPWKTKGLKKSEMKYYRRRRGPKMELPAIKKQ